MCIILHLCLIPINYARVKYVIMLRDETLAIPVTYLRCRCHLLRIRPNFALPVQAWVLYACSSSNQVQMNTHDCDEVAVEFTHKVQQLSPYVRRNVQC